MADEVDQTEPESLFTGDARLRHNDTVVGTVRVELTTNTDDRYDATWHGRILGSDYVMWGMNHKKVDLDLPDGQTVTCVVLATGKLRGLGNAPNPQAP